MNWSSFTAMGPQCEQVHPADPGERQMGQRKEGEEEEERASKAKFTVGRISPLRRTAINSFSQRGALHTAHIPSLAFATYCEPKTLSIYLRSLLSMEMLANM